EHIEAVIEEKPEEYVAETVEAEKPEYHAEVMIEEQPQEYVEAAEAELPEKYREMTVDVDSSEEDVKVAGLSEKTEEVKVVLQEAERRHLLRINILITEDMTKKLMDLKESR
ncbi:MAG: hypothetical protein K2L07_16575, partial [Lachnospiraceae bacterium]|nr:hypothetical protein [Lachnospiraceae bacterium]